MFTSQTNSEVLALRKSGGYSFENDIALIEVTGGDAGRFLQARLSNDVLSLQPGQGQMTALLDRKAFISVLGYLYRLPERFLLLVSRRKAQEALTLMEEFRFREKVEFRLLDTSCFAIDSNKADLFVLNLWGAQQRLAPAEHSVSERLIDNAPVLIMRHSTAGVPGLLVIREQSQAAGEQADRASTFTTACQQLNMVNISAEAIATARLEAGYIGLDISGVLLPELGLESQCVSYTKGCFPGQEVLARIKTYGAPRRGVAGFTFDSGEGSVEGKPADVISLQSEVVGEVLSIAFSPTLNRTLAIVCVNREYRVPGEQLRIELNQTQYAVTVTTLPFVTAEGKGEQARALYEKALQEFTSGSETEAIKMLQEVIDLDPMFGDAYETLGVILSRNDRLDEAIATTRQLAALDPDSIMAHANLSVFYMQKGDKQAAEDEKALAMAIRMSQIARSAAAEQKEAEERAAFKAAASERMEMFRQVLQIDPEDFLANAGLGSVYVDLEQFADAVPYLQKALSKRANHTVAYVSLGEALERLGKIDEAIATYKQGVAVAAQRGDGEPLKKMQIRLQKLGAEATAS